MASIKISDLQNVTEINGTDVVPIVNNNDTKKVSVDQLKEALGGGGSNYFLDLTTGENPVSVLQSSEIKSKIQEWLDNIKVGKFSDIIIKTNFEISGTRGGAAIGYFKLNQFHIPRDTWGYVAGLGLYFIESYYYTDYTLNNSESTVGFLILADVDSNGQITNISFQSSSMGNAEARKVVPASIYGEYDERYDVDPGMRALSVGNTKEYTPAEDYNPATKKYVDDAVAGSGSNTPSFVWDGSTGDEAKALFQSWINYYTETGLMPQILFEQNGNKCTCFSYSRIANEGTFTFYTFWTEGSEYYPFSCNVGTLEVGFIDKDSNEISYIAKRFDNKTHFLPDKYAGPNGPTYASKGYNATLTTNNSVEYIPTGDYNPATKKYVDDAVAGAGGNDALDGIYALYSTRDYGDTWSSEVLDNSSEMLANVDYVINDAYKKGFIKGIIFSTSYRHSEYRFYNSIIKNLNDKPTLISFGTNVPYFESNNMEYALQIKQPKLIIRGTWTDDVFKATSFSFGNVGQIFMDCWTKSSLARKYLSKTNVTTYTPTSDYNPATKKYVDDAIATSITNVLGGEY